jgi:hypothetical protein
VSLAARAWIAAARARERLGRRPPAREDLVRRHAPGASFADVGCMWSVDGAIAFEAEAAGATRVTGVDLMPESERYRAEHARRGSQVRFVQGDLHDPATLEAVGPHDVVFCSGVLYHAPNPVLTLERLRAITGRTLILGTESLPEVPGVPNACVFYPGLSERDRRPFAGPAGAARVGLSGPFEPAQGYGNWWWGITPSALRGMALAAGFEVIETLGRPFFTTLIARPLN